MKLIGSLVGIVSAIVGTLLFGLAMGGLISLTRD